MLEIHGVPISVHTRKVIVTAIEKNLPYQLNQVVPVMPDSLPANWRKVSPTGLIPVITEGDFTLADSSAICAYIDRAYPGKSLYPTDPKSYGQAIWFEQYAGGTVFKNVVHPLFIEVFVQPNVNRIPSDQARIDGVLNTAVPEIFGYLESRIGKDRFLVGEHMSLGDVAIASNLITFQYIGFKLDAVLYPKLAAWFGRVIQQPCMCRAIQLEQGAVQAMGLDGSCVKHLLA